MHAPAPVADVRRSAAAIAAIGAALVWTYRETIVRLVAQWGNDANYSHGFLVLPLALAIAWSHHERLRNAPRQPTLAGAALVAVSLLLYVAGRLGAELFLTRVSLVGVLAGSIAFVWGRAHLRILAFPVVFLLFMVPLPAIVFNQLTFPLQLVASSAGELVIRAAGIPVLRDGNVLQLPTRTFEVAEACSGIRSVVSLLMLAVVIGHFTERRTLLRVLLAVAAIPVAIAANALRVAGTGIAAEWISPDAAEGFFHTFSGGMIFVVAALGLSGLQQLFSRFAWNCPDRIGMKWSS